jgi:hypothetical protein
MLPFCVVYSCRCVCMCVFTFAALHDMVDLPQTWVRTVKATHRLASQFQRPCVAIASNSGILPSRTGSYVASAATSALGLSLKPSLSLSLVLSFFLSFFVFLSVLSAQLQCLLQLSSHTSGTRPAAAYKQLPQHHYKYPNL